MRLVLAIAVASVSAVVGAYVISACDEDSGCSDDFDCERAFVCKVSSATCEPFVCKVDADCEGGLACDDNECR